MTMEIVIAPDGIAKYIYDQTLDLSLLGRPDIRRASHVEPVRGCLWQADLSPTGGPVLGLFAKRSDAIEAELEWLRSHWINACRGCDSLGRCMGTVAQRTRSALRNLRARGRKVTGGHQVHIVHYIRLCLVTTAQSLSLHCHRSSRLCYLLHNSFHIRKV